ncbi:phosphoribosyltransferase [Myxosarcina sp. GI1]|uniref:phosphoribosyltransferase n=1 Tax=Myxosarcina sp. GI1 TaxID=1541065 RepID=UPI00055D6E0E|nr:phosphoribosyltransferase family protein [Myxosarcina sp. GI1]
MKTILPNRKEAGRRLAKQLTSYANHPQAIVLGLPRGGVPVAHELARELNLPLDVCLVKKLWLPNFSETAIGAIAEDALVHDYSGNVAIIDENTTQIHQVASQQLKAIAAREKAELRWRDRCYRSFRPMLKVRGRIIILVDDGMATGCTIHAAVTALRQHQPDKIIVAIPVASSMAIERSKSQVDKVVCLLTPKHFQAIGFSYENFPTITDCQVCDLLSQETQKSLVATY